MDRESPSAPTGFPARTSARARALLLITPHAGPTRSLLWRLAVLATAVLLTACSLPLGPNQAYLTITNPNSPMKGTFNYTTIILDGVVLPYTITAGASQQLAVTYNQSHTLSYSFYAKPTGGTATTTPEGPFAIYVPQGGYVYLGATYP